MADAGDGFVLFNDDFMKCNVSAGIYDCASERMSGAGNRPRRTVVLGQTTGDHQVLKDHPRPGLNDLKHPVMKLAGVNNRRLLAR